MHYIDFFVISKFCVKQLTIFERTVVAASDFKNCTMVNCDFDILCSQSCHSVKGTIDLFSSIDGNSHFQKKMVSSTWYYCASRFQVTPVFC